MESCSQTTNQSVLQHGYAVKAAYEAITNEEISLPGWYYLYRKFIESSRDSYPREEVELYQIYHDCGKPFCFRIDESSRKHFPNHAEISATVFSSIFGERLAGTWIRHDMDIHTISASEIHAFCQIDGAIILLLTGLAELYANAKMFGGLESESFKIKYKHLNRRAKAVCKHLWGTP